MSWGADINQDPVTEHLFPAHRALKKPVHCPLLQAAGCDLGSLYSCAPVLLLGGVQVKCPLAWGDWQVITTVFPVSCPEWPFRAFTGGGSRWLLGTPVSLLRLRHTHALCGRKGKCFPHQQMLACLILLLAYVASDWSQRCSWSTST